MENQIAVNILAMWGVLHLSWYASGLLMNAVSILAIWMAKKHMLK